MAVGSRQCDMSVTVEQVIHIAAAMASMMLAALTTTTIIVNSHSDSSSKSQELQIPLTDTSKMTE